MKFSLQVFCVLELEKFVLDNSNTDDEMEKLKKQLEDEKLKKTQAVNKLAEILNRKDMQPNKKDKKVSAAELRKKEKELRKLQQEFTQVRPKSKAKKLNDMFLIACITFKPLLH